MTRLTTPERALGLLLLLAAPVAAAGGLVAGVTGALGVAGCGLLLALAAASALGGIDPRTHRPLAWPVGLGLLGLAAGAARGARPAVAVGALLAGLLVLGLLAAAVRSVHGSWLRGGPPAR